MSLGLPNHLARATHGLALNKALHAVAFAALICGALTVLAFIASSPGSNLWPALIAVIAMGFALWLNDHFDSVLFDISYLAVGAAGLYWYCVAFHTQLESALAADAIWLAMPKIALVMVAGAGVGAGSALAWCLIGYLTAELVALVASIPYETDVPFDASTFAAFLIVATTTLLNEFARFRSRKAQPRLHRAARDERIASFRSGMELKAAALLHDTVLSHLAAIANAPGTRLSQELTAQIRRDLEVFVGEEWLNETEPSPNLTSFDWSQSPLFNAITEARRLGLEIVDTGDLNAVSRLNKARSNALGLAVKQCLANVIKHSGTMKAEVAVYGSETEVSVMVIDTGRGFDVKGVQSDRLGLRASVRRRMEGVGGSVQVWSTVGSGTSVLIQVPTGTPAKPVVTSETEPLTLSAEQSGEPG